MAQLLKVDPLDQSALQKTTRDNPGTGAFEMDVPVSLFISGSVERVMYFNEETGHSVLDIKPDEFKNHILIAGRVSSVYPGQSIEAYVTVNSIQQKIINSGEGIIEALLPATGLKPRAPNSKRTTKTFLKSGAIAGIGPHLATTLSQTFPNNLFSTLETEPTQIGKIKGVGKKRQSQILEAWENYRGITKFEEFLFQEGLPLNWAKIIWPAHESDSLSYFKKNPYRVAREQLLSFDLIDSYALKEGFPIESSERVRAALYDLLQNYYKQGHCAYPEEKILKEAFQKLEVSSDLIDEALELELLEEILVSDVISGTTCIYLKEIWELEQDVAIKLLSFQNKQPSWGWMNMEKVLNWAQSLLHIKLAPLQISAIETALSSSLTVITGGPGTGKTTLIRSLVTILQTQFSQFALCSPTGRAAQRLSEATGAPAQTIHRLLKLHPTTGKFSFNRENPLQLDLILIDEMSMVDLSLMSSLLDAIPPQCALIMVGDADQIPSVGAGTVLQSVIASNQFNTVRLTDIFRQRETSLIKLNAHRINNSKMPLPTVNNIQNDFHYIPVHSVDQTKRVILELVTKTIPKKCGITDPSQMQILVPMNRGPLGTQQLNQELQEYLTLNSTEFPSNQRSESLIGFDQTFKTGDKVMVIKNDYKKDIFNGDIGFIHNIDHYEQYIDIHFDERSVRFGFDELDRLTLAYAISIHKSQGSEYRAVIVVVSDEHLPMAQRHLIYTAVTRGKEHVFLVANPSALQAAILSDESNRRWQRLTELLKGTSELGLLQ
ncbi:MAG: AAA family ATPase [Bdellovibrionota bacterium]